MKKENPGGFSFFIGAELRIRVKSGKVKRRHKKIFAGAVYHNAQTSCATRVSPGDLLLPFGQLALCCARAASAQIPFASQAIDPHLATTPK